jgi:hypothetical protein
MQEVDEFDNEGLESRLEKFVSGKLNEPEPPTPPIVPDPPKEDDEEPEIVVNPPKETPSTEDEEFPELGKKATPNPSADDSDVELDEEIKGMEPKAGEKWKALKAELKLAKQEAEAAKAGSKVSPEIETELAELRQKAAEVEVLRQRNEELLRANDRVAVEESDEYISKVKTPYSEMEKALKSLSEHSKVPLDSLIDIITEEDIAKQDSLIEELEGKVGARMAGRVGRIADDYKAVTETKTRLLENAKQTLEQSRISRSLAEKQEKERSAQAYRVSTEESFKSYASRIPGFVDSTGNLTDLAKSVMQKTASMDPSTLDSSDLGYMAFCANSFPEARKAIVRLQEEVKMLKAAQGNPSPPSGSTTPRGGNDEDSEIGLADRMKGLNFTFSPP